MDRWVEAIWSWNSGLEDGDLGFSQYGVRSNIKGQRSEHDVGGVCPLNFYPSFSFFIFCSLIYSGLRWHRGLDSACCQTKALQCSQNYSDPVSALSAMRSPQCYVSLTEKYSHTEKDAILQVEALLYWCCTDKGNIHRTHLQNCRHTYTTGEKELLCVLLGFFVLMGFWPQQSAVFICSPEN